MEPEAQRPLDHSNTPSPVAAATRGFDTTWAVLPTWFRRMGLGAWLLVGVVLVLIGAVWLLEQTASIVDPLIAGFVIGAVAGIFVDRLESHGWPRAAGASVVILVLVGLGVLMVGLVLGGVSSQSHEINASTSDGLDKIQSWAQDLGITSAPQAAAEIRKAVPALGHTLLSGVAHGIAGLASLVVFLGFTAFSAFFLLKDGPALGNWIERHMGLQRAEARVVMSDIIQALRRYFLGLTILAGISTAGVVAGAAIVGVPLLGTIAIVSFIASYVPIIGAWTSGIFVFVLTLGHVGTTEAWIMAVVIFLCNGPLQQIVQPVVYGATLRLNPLVVFSVTIAAGTLFGITGMVLAAPLISAAVRVKDDLAKLNPLAGDRGAATLPATPGAAAADAGSG